jgi:preprotein translocase subunit SecF
MIKLPDPYQGNYKLLVLIPIILVLASAWFIPQIKKGVDFKGGTLVTMQTESGVDAELLKGALLAKGFQISSVKSLQNPKGFEVEVEIERDGKLTRAEELKSAFFAKIEEVSRLESDVTSSNQSAEAVQKYVAARKEVDEGANEIFGFAGVSKNATSYRNTNDLKKAVAAGYKQVLDNESEKLISSLSELVKYDTVSFNEVSASLSEKFIDKALAVVIYSTIFVSIVVFLIFRTAVPSAAVLIGAAADIIIALGAMGLFGIPLTLASFAALLMLVGFSLDTDVLLTMRVIKRTEGTARKRAYDAMRTGTTMSMALLVSFICLFVLASVTHINTYYEISAVAIAGLVGDLFATWLLNAVIVLHYVEAKGQTGEGGKPFLSSIFSN